MSDYKELFAAVTKAILDSLPGGGNAWAVAVREEESKVQFLAVSQVFLGVAIPRSRLDDSSESLMAEVDQRLIEAKHNLIAEVRTALV